MAVELSGSKMRIVHGKKNIEAVVLEDKIWRLVEALEDQERRRIRNMSYTG